MEWDAVELPSQFMENWCWEREVLDMMSGHWQTGARLPEPLYQKMLAGLGEKGDLELLEDVSSNIRGRSFCPLADACIMPVQASIKHFRHEYEYIIEHGKSMYPKQSRWAD